MYEQQEPSSTQDSEEERYKNRIVYGVSGVMLGVVLAVMAFS